MPIYEYRCQKCQYQFEEIQKMSDPPVAVCPKCNGQVERLISQTSFALKGQGWYKDGYSSVKPEPAKPAAAATTTATDKPAKTEPKPPASTNKGD